MGVRAAHEDDVDDAVDPQVVEESPLAAQQRRVLAAACGAADVRQKADLRARSRAAAMGRPDCTITPMCRAWGGFALAAALVASAPTDVGAQVFIAASSRPEFTIGPLFVGATAPTDVGTPVNVTVTWNLVPLRAGRASPQTLALLWPAEIAASTAPGAADPALVNYVESRGFTSTGSGRLALRARNQSQLGLLTPPDDLPVTAPYVSFVRRDAPPQAGNGSIVWIPATPLMGDPRWVLTLTLPLRGLIVPKPATWLEDVFWGRRNVLALSWGDVGSVAFYPLYHEHRESIVHLAREYSRLLVSFPDADHLRIEGIEPASATRRGSRLRAGTETVTLPLNTVDSAPQVLKVQYAYYRGVFAWRPVLISLGLLILGNLTGLLMISGRVFSLVRSRLRVTRRAPAGEPTPLTPDRLAEIRPGESTYDDVVRLCGLPDEQHRRVAAGTRRTLVYRATQRRPERGLSVGWLATVRHWDIERHEIEIELDDERVQDVVIHVRRSRASSPD
jgi:hypothetical protein